MLRFFYNILVPFCMKKSIDYTLLYIDTDGIMLDLIYPLQPPNTPLPDLYKDIFELIEHLDLSDMDLQHPFFQNLNPEELAVALHYREKNKRVPGLFSDGYLILLLKNFVGFGQRHTPLRPVLTKPL